MAKSETKMTVEDYLDQLSQSLSKKQKAGKDVVLNILRVCDQEPERKQKISEKNRIETLTEITVRNMSKFTAQELLDIFQFFESLQVDLDTFFDEWEKAMAEKLNGDMIIHLLQGYNHMERKMGDQMLKKWSKEGETMAEKWDESDLIFVVKVFHKIYQKPSSEFIRKWADAVTKIERNLEADHILDLFRGCGKLWMRDPEIEIFLEQLIADCDKNEIHKMNTKQLVQLMQALGQLRMDPSQHSSHFVPMWFDQIHPKLDQLDKKTLTRIGWVMSRSRVKPIDETFAEDWARNVKARISDFTTKELGMSLDGMVHFWLTASKYEPLHLEWIEVAQPKLEGFWPQKLASVVYHFRRLGTMPKEDFISAWLEACQNQISSMYIRDLVYIMEGLAAIPKNPDPDFLDIWKSETEKKITHISPQPAQYLKEALNVLQIEMSPHLKKYVDRAAAKNVNKETKISKKSPKPKENERPASKTLSGEVGRQSKQSVEEARPSSKTSGAETRPSSKQTSMEQRPSSKEIVVEPRPSSKETAIEPRPSSKGTAVEPRPSSKEIVVEPRPSSKETAMEPRPSSKGTAVEPRPSSKGTPVEPRPSSEEVANVADAQSPNNSGTAKTEKRPQSTETEFAATPHAIDEVAETHSPPAMTNEAVQQLSGENDVVEHPPSGKTDSEEKPGEIDEEARPPSEKSGLKSQTAPVQTTETDSKESNEKDHPPSPEVKPRPPSSEEDVPTGEKDDPTPPPTNERPGTVTLTSPKVIKKLPKPTIDEKNEESKETEAQPLS